MTVLRSPLRSVLRSPLYSPLVGKWGGAFSPSALFQSGDILLWYDPSDLTTMFKDTAGTQPVTADGDSVALMLDKGQWGGKTLEQVLAAQPELVTNGSFATDTSGWALRAATGGAISWSSGALRFERPPSGLSIAASQLITGLVVGRLYRLAGQARVVSGGGVAFLQLRTADGGGGSTLASTTNTASSSFAQLTGYWLATQTSAYVSIVSDTPSAIIEGDDISVKEIPGYHRVQATGTSMPKYKTGPNPAAAENSPELVTNGGFDTDTAWGKGATTVISSGVASSTATPAGSNIVTQTAMQPGAGKNVRVQFTVSNWTGGGLRVFINNDFIDLAGKNGTYIFTMYSTLGAGSGLLFRVNTTAFTGDIDNISVKEIPASAPYIHWLLYDGTDDSHSTSGINWGTDEIAACVGLYKSSDAAQACFAAFGTNGGTAGVSAEQGLILAPGAAAATTYYARFTGSLTPTQAVATGYAAPNTGVVSARGKIATDLQGISVNRGTEALGSGDMGTGNFGSAIPMHFGRRASTSIPFSGREYQTVIRSRLLSAAELSSLETFVAEKTGVIL